jgi:hypothetical protein
MCISLWQKSSFQCQQLPTIDIVRTAPVSTVLYNCCSLHFAQTVQTHFPESCWLHFHDCWHYRLEFTVLQIRVDRHHVVRHWNILPPCPNIYHKSIELEKTCFFRQQWLFTVSVPSPFTLK